MDTQEAQVHLDKTHVMSLDAARLQFENDGKYPVFYYNTELNLVGYYKNQGVMIEGSGISPEVMRTNVKGSPADQQQFVATMLLEHSIVRRHDAIFANKESHACKECSIGRPVFFIEGTTLGAAYREGSVSSTHVKTAMINVAGCVDAFVQTIIHLTENDLFVRLDGMTSLRERYIQLFVTHAFVLNSTNKPLTYAFLTSNLKYVTFHAEVPANQQYVLLITHEEPDSVVIYRGVGEMERYAIASFNEVIDSNGKLVSIHTLFEQRFHPANSEALSSVEALVQSLTAVVESDKRLSQSCLQTVKQLTHEVANLKV